MDDSFFIFFAIFMAGIIAGHLMPKGVIHKIDAVVDHRGEAFLTWSKKRWYTRLMLVFITPIVFLVGIVIGGWVIAPLSLLAEGLFFFPGKLIYWIAKGNFPERKSLFQPWERKEENSPVKLIPYKQ